MLECELSSGNPDIRINLCGSRESTWFIRISEIESESQTIIAVHPLVQGAMKFSQAEIFLPGRLSVDSDLFSKMSSNPSLEYIHIFGMAALKNYSAHIEGERNHLLIAVYELEKRLRADMGVFGVQSVVYEDHFQYCTTFKPIDPGIFCC